MRTASKEANPTFSDKINCLVGSLERQFQARPHAGMELTEFDARRDRDDRLGVHQLLPNNRVE